VVTSSDQAMIGFDLPVDQPGAAAPPSSQHSRPFSSLSRASSADYKSAVGLYGSTELARSPATVVECVSHRQTGGLPSGWWCPPATVSDRFTTRVDGMPATAFRVDKWHDRFDREVSRAVAARKVGLLTRCRRATDGTFDLQRVASVWCIGSHAARRWHLEAFGFRVAVARDDVRLHMVEEQSGWRGSDPSSAVSARTPFGVYARRLCSAEPISTIGDGGCWPWVRSG
jgi:hypothetical protein